MQSKDNAPFSIYLLGDPGAVRADGNDPVINTLAAHLDDDPNATVVYLGDLLYPDGLPAKDAKNRELMEARLSTMLSPLLAHDGRVILLPGNHDYRLGLDSDDSVTARLERYVNAFMGHRVFYPPNGCPGPVTIDLPHLRLLILNTEWWLQKGLRPIGESYGCKVETQDGVFELIESEIQSAKPDQQVLVLAHSPLYSDAVHGGRFKWHHHLFPFRTTRKHLWIPLPFIGTLINWYRRFVGLPEDISHPRFRRFRSQILDIFKRNPGCIYASGHEHNLQYIHKHQTHFLVSGSASKNSYVSPGNYSQFASKKKGMMRLSGSLEMGLQLETIVPGKAPKGEVIFRTQLESPEAPAPAAILAQSET